MDGCATEKFATVYVSPAEFCSCFIQFVSGEVGSSLSQQLHNILVPKLEYMQKSYVFITVYLIYKNIDPLQSADTDTITW